MISLMSKTILVVDDDNLIRKSLAQALTEAGLTVVEAPNGKAGLDQALSSHPDMVVTDVRMPELDGLAMVEKLRADDWGKQVPIIVLTTDDSTASVNQALSAGVTTYLSKSSLSPDQIAAQIVSVLG